MLYYCTMHKFIYFLFLLFFFIGCSRDIPTPTERYISMEKNLPKTYKINTYITTKFNIFSVQDKIETCSTLNVYIEGDGLSWITRSLPSYNPTPITPVALNLMKEDTTYCKLYLARPCQYVNSSTCEQKYWTNARFSSPVIDSYQDVLNQIKAIYNNLDFNLIGYSGGGAIASIVAGKRDDIKMLITVAGNLNPDYWTTYHNISSLNGLNPINYTDKLSSINQTHFIGDNDTIIPIEIFYSYYKYFNNKNNIQYKVLENTTHTQGWVGKWKEISQNF